MPHWDALVTTTKKVKLKERRREGGDQAGSVGGETDPEEKILIGLEN